MKNNFTLLNTLVIAALCLTPSAARAQPELETGVKGGLNAATEAEDFRVNRYGISGGLFGCIQWRLFDEFSLGGQVDLLYTPRGAEVVFQGEHAGQLREHYIDLPIAVRPEAHFGRASVYLLLGAEFSFLLSANKDDAAGAGQDITGDLHRIDVAVLGAAGIVVHLPPREMGPFHLGTVFLEARHDIGLLNVDAVNGGFKNRTSSLMIGLSFVVGGPPAPTTTSTSQVADLRRERSASGP